MQPNYFLETHEMEVLVDAAKIAYRLANTTVRIVGFQEVGSEIVTV